MDAPSTILYKRATFVTRLPTPYLYSPSHAWLAQVEPNLWHVGYTKFALRMLGELVDLQIDSPLNSPVQPGDILGSIEGFKAVSDLYCVGQGAFLGANPNLATSLDPVARDPYHAGWIYQFRGAPDPRCLDVDAYQALLNATIDRILAKQKAEEST